MAKDSKIEWTEHTANLWHGCTKVHEGCDNCYAETLSKRWGNDIWGNDKPRKVIESVWKDLDRFQKEAAAAGEMHRVFVGSMMDIFEKPMPLIDNKGFYAIDASDGSPITTEHLRGKLFNEVIPASPNLMFLLLTKRPSNINKYIPESWKTNPPENVMFGTSPVNQATANKLVPQLLQVNGKRFLSCEPLLGPIKLGEWLDTCPKSKRVDGPFHSWLFDGDDPYVKCHFCGEIRDALNGRTVFKTHETPVGIHWIICGGESGHGARPMHPSWAISLRDQCATAGVPFFFKQWGEYGTIYASLETGNPVFKMYRSYQHFTHKDWVNKKDVCVDLQGKLCKTGADMMTAVYPVAIMTKMGKKESGRMLDGHFHDAYPKTEKPSLL